MPLSWRVFADFYGAAVDALSCLDDNTERFALFLDDHYFLTMDHVVTQ